MAINLDDFPHFETYEVSCSHCRERGDKPGLPTTETACNNLRELLSLLEAMRERLGFPLRLSSCYRCPEHPVEAHKAEMGEHSWGAAADILVCGTRAMEVIQAAVICRGDKTLRLGVKQGGPMQRRFIHVGLGCETREVSYVWSYRI